MFPVKTFSLAEPQISARGAKSCTLSGKDGKVIFALGDRTTPASTPFGASTYGDDVSQRKTLELRLTDAQAQEFVNFDIWAIDYLTEHSERLFKKKQTRSQIEEHYRSPVTRKEGYQPLLRTKLNTEGRNAVRVWNEHNERMPLPEDLRQYELVPRLHLSHLWVMGRDYGWVFSVSDLQILQGGAEAPCPFGAVPE